MAFNITSNYTGKDSTEFFAKTLLGGETTKNVSVRPGIKFKENLKLFSVGNLVQTGSTCNWNASGDITLTEKVLEPKEHKVQTSVCVNDLEKHWESAKFKAGAAGQEIPSDFQTYILDYFGQKINTELETLFWQGNTASGSTFNGFLTQLAADDTVIKQTSTGITSSTVETEFDKVYAKIPDQILGAEDLKIFIPIATYKAVNQKIAASSLNTSFTREGKDLFYHGIPLVVTKGIPANKMVAAKASSLVIGTDLESDMNEVQVLYMKPIDTTDNVRFASRFKIDVGYPYGSEIVVYA